MTTDDKSKGLYLMQDGTYAAPGDVSKDKDGVLRNKAGMAAAVDADGKPQTLGALAESSMNVAAAKAGKPEPDKPEEVKAAAPAPEQQPKPDLIPPARKG